MALSLTALPCAAPWPQDDVVATVGKRPFDTPTTYREFIEQSWETQKEKNALEAEWEEGARAAAEGQEGEAQEGADEGESQEAGDAGQEHGAQDDAADEEARPDKKE